MHPCLIHFPYFDFYFQALYVLGTERAFTRTPLGTISIPAQSLTSGVKQCAHVLKALAGKIAHLPLLIWSRETMSGTFITHTISYISRKRSSVRYYCHSNLMPPNLTLHCPVYRSSLCNALVTAATFQDDSSGLLDTLSASLQSAFSADEVTLAPGKGICSKALLKVSSLARSGYLEGVQSATQSVADLISSYTVLNNVTSGNSTLYPVDEAVSDNRYFVTLTIFDVSLYLDVNDMVTPNQPLIYCSTAICITGEQFIAWSAQRNGSRRVSCNPLYT